MPVKLLLAGMAGLMLATPRRRTEGPAAVVAAHADHLAMKAAPINSDWIIRGTPLARIGEHSTSTDQASSTAVWDCTAGEFRWYFNWDETVVIQEGEVHVTDADGEVRLLRAGDIAYFRGGAPGPPGASTITSARSPSCANPSPVRSPRCTGCAMRCVRASTRPSEVIAASGKFKAAGVAITGGAA